MDRLFQKDVETWTAGDLDDLVTAKIPEGMRLEYKRELNLDSKAARAEAAKDVSGLANAQGGLLIYGIEEDDSPEPLPRAVSPMPEGMQTTLENILDSSLEPRPDFHAATVRLDGGVAIVIRVAGRRGNPIMVQGYGEFRYYKRSGTRTRRMLASEVADAHSQAKSRLEAFDQRLRGLPLVSRIYRYRSQDELRIRAEGVEPPEWLPMATVVVAAIDGPETLISADRMALREFPEDAEGSRGARGRTVLPGVPWSLNALSCEQRIGDADDPRIANHVVAVFRAGVIEWARRYEVPGNLPSSTFADDAHNALLFGARVLNEVGYAGRVGTWIRVENADKATLSLPHPWSNEVSTQTPTFEALSSYREVSSDELLENATPIVRHAMDLIWQGFGVSQCFLFDENGDWTNPG